MPSKTRPSVCFTLVLSILVGAVAGCKPTTPANQTQRAAPLNVTVSIAPQQYFVERIANGYATVNVMVPPGAEPHTFEPKPNQLKALSRANLYLQIRIDFEEAWMPKFKSTNPKMLIVDTTQGIQRLPVPAGMEEHDTQGHPSASSNLDPHIWLSPRQVKTQAQNIYNALIKLDPSHQTAYQSNLNRFLQDIDGLDAEIRQSLQGVKNRKFIVFHPGWGYFARDYQLQQIPIEVGGQEPSAAEMASLIAQAKKENVRVIFAEPQFSQQSAKAIAREIGGEVILIDPLSKDWLNNLRQASQTFARVLGATTSRQRQRTLKIGQNNLRTVVGRFPDEQYPSF